MMTRNQIEYQALQETKRSNLARELETSRANLANEALTRDRNVETRRSNKASELLSRLRDLETARSNLAKESENVRSNVARETDVDQRFIFDVASEIANLFQKERNNVVANSTDLLKLLPMLIGG